MPHQCTNCSRTFPDGSKEMLSGCPDCGGNKFQFAPSRADLDAGSSSDPTDRSGDAGSDGDDGSPSRPDQSSKRPDGAVSRAANTVRNWVSDDSGATGDPTDAGAETGTNEANRTRPSNRRQGSDGDAGVDTSEFSEWPETARPPADRDSPEETAIGVDPPEATDAEFERVDADEDSAQASARSDVVSPDELPSPPESPGIAETREDEDVPDHGRVVSEPAGERPSLEDLREELNDQFESIKIIQPGQYELNLMELYDREEYIVSLQEDGRYVIDVPDSWRETDE